MIGQPGVLWKELELESAASGNQIRWTQTRKLGPAGISSVAMNTIFSFVMVLGLSANLFAKDYCSLLVKVVDAEGREVEADVTVTERDGRKIEQQNRPGGVKFCD